MKPYRLYLRTWLILVVVACVLPLSGLSLGMQFISYRNARNDAALRTLELARSLSLALERELQARISLLQVLAQSKRLQEGDLAGFRTKAIELTEQQLFPGAHIILLRQDGQQVMNTGLPPDAPLPARHNLDTIRRVVATVKPSVSGVFNAPADGSLTVAIEVPVLDVQGKVIYVLALNPPFTVFSEIIRRQHPHEGWFVSLLDDHGVIVARLPSIHIGLLASPHFLQHLLTEHEGFLDTKSWEGTPVLSAFSHTENFGWSAGVGVPETALVAQPLRAALGTFAAGLVLLISGLLMAGAIARRITGPISALRRLAAVTEGELRDEPLVNTLRETAEVAEAFRIAARERQLALEAGAIGIFNWDIKAGQLRWDERMRQMWAVPRGSLADISMFYAGIRPGDRADVAVLLENAMNATGNHLFVAEFQIVGLSDGAPRAVAVRGRVIFEADTPTHMLGTAVDITARRAAEDRQSLLAREVDHRAKNVLAVVQSIVRMAPRTVTPQEFAESIEGRVIAMARAHSVLASEHWEGADLRAIIEGEMAIYAERVRLDGPLVRLAPSAAQPIALLLHEFATNAAKHGALSKAGGTVHIAWEFMVDGALRLCWTERGGLPITQAPQRPGFGSRLMSSLGERQLGGSLERQWLPTGLVLVLTVLPRHARAITRSVGSPATDAHPRMAPHAVMPLAPGVATFDGHTPMVLVVEDEALLAMELEQAVRALGYGVIGPAQSLAEALRFAAGNPRPDAAVLDVNLAGEMVFPAADILATRDIPMLFVTGYGSATSLAGRGFTATAVLHKPYPLGLLGEALSRALGIKRVPGEKNITAKTIRKTETNRRR